MVRRLRANWYGETQQVGTGRCCTETFPGPSKTTAVMDDGSDGNEWAGTGATTVFSALLRTMVCGDDAGRNRNGTV